RCRSSCPILQMASPVCVSSRVCSSPHGATPLGCRSKSNDRGAPKTVVCQKCQLATLTAKRRETANWPSAAPRQPARKKRGGGVVRKKKQKVDEALVTSF